MTSKFQLLAPKWLFTMVTAVLMALLILTCETDNVINQAPISVAGPDQVIILPTTSASLDGSTSSDPDGTINTWLWKKISGPDAFDMVSPTSAKTDVKSLMQGIYQFELNVTDDGGLTAKDTVKVSVLGSAHTNYPPVAHAGPDQYIILPLNSTILDGSGSTDDHFITYYEWYKISGPSSFNIVNPFTAQTELTDLVEGVYVFGLFVSDLFDLESVDTVQITVLSASPPTETDRDIYVAGYEYNGTHHVAKYWKNGVAVTLTDGTKDAEATCIKAVGSDVYVAGFETNGSNIKVAKYWKNGVVVNLTDGIHWAEATSIAVEGSDVYVTGYEINGNNIQVAKYWKNGIAVTFSNGLSNAVATDITFVGSDVYVSGYDGRFAKYWKNGQEFKLNDGTKWATTHSIAVAGSDVYVAGEETDGGVYEVKYWKNGIAVSLNYGGDNASAASIAVVDGNVYVAGYSDRCCGSWAKYWKNGQEFGLGDPNSAGFANDIAVMDTDVYVAGSEHSWNGNYWDPGVAKYWKNGQAVNLTNGLNSAVANSIVVIKH